MTTASRSALAGLAGLLAVSMLAEPAAAVAVVRRPPVHRGGAVVVHPGHGVRPGHVVRPGGVAVVAPGRWVRPYRWAPGGAIAAGAAIGFVAAASAAAYYSSPPPQPGMCWYYTDPSKRNGFWDVCP
jgi:hypothetical protein